MVGPKLLKTCTFLSLENETFCKLEHSSIFLDTTPTLGH